MPLKRFESHKNSESLSMETVACPSESHSIPINLYIFTCKFSLQEVLGLVWGFWLLLYYYILYTNPPAKISLEHTREKNFILQKTHQKAYENSKNHNSCRGTWCFDLGMCGIGSQLKKKNCKSEFIIEGLTIHEAGYIYKEMSKDWGYWMPKTYLLETEKSVMLGMRQYTY